MHASLPKSYRDFFSFRIATTSYIYPDNILPNVRMLAPYLDEIELVLFESGQENNLPSTDDIRQLASISQEQGLTYHVHLPIDIFLGDADHASREHEAAITKKIILLTSPLEPSTYTLHLSLTKSDRQNERELNQWKERVCNSLKDILSSGVKSSKISVETLDYPFELVEDIVEAFALSVCLDIGHLFYYGHPVSDYSKKYLAQTTVVHVHGVEKGRDHKSLDVLGEKEKKQVWDIISSFAGVVSVEVFSFHDLSSSLTLMEKWYHQQ